MDKKIVALALIVCVAVATVAVIYVKLQQPTQGEDEFRTIDDQLKELDNYLNFENQEFDYNLGDISGVWG